MVELEATAVNRSLKKQRSMSELPLGSERLQSWNVAPSRERRPLGFKYMRQRSIHGL